jgi:hypothetical protein
MASGSRWVPWPQCSHLCPPGHMSSGAGEAPISHTVPHWTHPTSLGKEQQRQPLSVCPLQTQRETVTRSSKAQDPSQTMVRGQDGHQTPLGRPEDTIAAIDRKVTCEEPRGPEKTPRPWSRLGQVLGKQRPCQAAESKGSAGPSGTRSPTDRPHTPWPSYGVNKTPQRGLHTTTQHGHHQTNHRHHTDHGLKVDCPKAVART